MDNEKNNETNDIKIEEVCLNPKEGENSKEKEGLKEKPLKSILISESELEIMRQSIEEQKKNTQDYYEQLLRLKADFENYRTRSEKEKKQHFEDGKKFLIIELIDVFETVKLAKGMIEKSASGESIREGLHLIENKLSEILKLHDIATIITVGEKFNPLFHEVVGVIEKDDVEEGVILEELRAGYEMAGKVFKPAMVKIAKITNRAN
ncbi:MAG: nucleotide exchange factor GrpE [Elusimicrobiota bacterium]